MGGQMCCIECLLLCCLIYLCIYVSMWGVVNRFLCKHNIVSIYLSIYLYVKLIPQKCDYSRHKLLWGKKRKTMVCSHWWSKPSDFFFIFYFSICHIACEKTPIVILIVVLYCQLQTAHTVSSHRFSSCPFVFDVLLTTHSFFFFFFFFFLNQTKFYLFFHKLGTSVKTQFVYTALFKYLEALCKWILGGPCILFQCLL